MNGNRVMVTAVAALVFVAAAAAAIYIFRNEIADFIYDIKARVDEKLLSRHGEYQDEQ